MLPLMGIAASDAHAPTDDVVVARVLSGDPAVFEVLMRRYNQRVFRAARSVLRDDAEAEDVVQDAWVRAYTHLRQFMGRASFATWVIRIAIHEAFARRRYRGRARATRLSSCQQPRLSPLASPYSGRRAVSPGTG